MEYVPTQPVQVGGTLTNVTRVVLPELPKLVTAVSPDRFVVSVTLAKKKEKPEPAQQE
jgi:hypothetical protein